MNIQYSRSEKFSSSKEQWNRADRAELVSGFAGRDLTVSEREFSDRAGVPRSTLRYWHSRKNSIDAHPALVELFESPVGIVFLHRLVTAAHVSFTKNGTASIHSVSDFLERSGLAPFVASSCSTQRRVSEVMNEKIIEFGKTEDKRLGRQMPEKTITLCEDETFHPEICLVAIEPVSNYILVEQYAMNRETNTWNEAVNDALGDLPVKVRQVASDEGRSLISHACKGLKAHHSSDCFHVTYEIGKGTSGALKSKVRKAEKELEKAVRQSHLIEHGKKVVNGSDQRLREQERAARENLDQARLNQETVRRAKAEIGNVYHPYNLNTGRRQDSRIVSELLGDCFNRIQTATVDLSDRCRKHVQKARRVVDSMVATITFFFQMVDICLENMRLSDRDRDLMHNYLIPGHYLKIAAEKERKIDLKTLIRERIGGIHGQSTDCKIEELEKASRNCAEIFQRSSSCVEGRNAQLALRHQGIHRLGEKQLKALTVVHNYYIKRRDGTTAAERFFEAEPEDLFDFLLDQMDYPVRPRNRQKLAA